MGQLYDRAFFDWVRLTAVRSAQGVLPVVLRAVQPTSVVDVGCGEGAWLSVWRALGVADVAGLDGAHVDRAALMVPAGCFQAADLARPFVLPRRFDLVQSLEVAEHLPPEVSRAFVSALCRLGDVVLFSAAQPGQGGENHINERLPSTWAALFRQHGYSAFDCVRPLVAKNGGVAPWYRFNTVLYANPDGRRRLSPEALATRCDHEAHLDGAGDWRWRLRCRILRRLPVRIVTRLSRLRYRLVCAPLGRGPSSLTPAQG